MGAFFSATAGVASSELKVVIGSMVLICIPDLALSTMQVMAIATIACTYVVGRSLVKLYGPVETKGPDANA